MGGWAAGWRRGEFDWADWGCCEVWWKRVLLESKRCPAELGVTNLCKCFTGCTDCDIYVQLIEGLIENCLGHETWAAFKDSSHCSPPSARIIMRFTLNRSVEGRLPCIKHALPRCHGAISAAGVHYIYAYIYPTHTHTLARPAQSEPYTICVLRFIMQIFLAARSTVSPHCACCCFLQAALFVIVAWLAAWKNIFI